MRTGLLTAGIALMMVALLAVGAAARDTAAREWRTPVRGELRRCHGAMGGPRGRHLTDRASASPPLFDTIRSGSRTPCPPGKPNGGP
jgi:hypothetical protein